MAKIERVIETPAVVARTLNEFLADHPAVSVSDVVVLKLHHKMEVHTDSEWEALNNELKSRQRFSD